MHFSASLLHCMFSAHLDRHVCRLTPFAPPPRFLVVKDPRTKTSQILVEPHLIDAEFRKAWVPFFCRSGHPVVTPDQFLDFVGLLLPQEPFLDLPRIIGRDLQEVARAKKTTAGGLDGWAWNEIKAFQLPWFSGLAVLLELVESTGVWPQGLPDGDSAPLGQRPLSVLPVSQLCRKTLSFHLYHAFGRSVS